MTISQQFSITVFLIFLVGSFDVKAQKEMPFVFEYKINRLYPYISITKETLNNATTLNDFKDLASGHNLGYDPSWIRKYLSVEVISSVKGKKRRLMSKNDTLSQDQKDLMVMADVGTPVSINVQYIPENTLKNNDPKELDFSFTVTPDTEAKYPGGDQKMYQYLIENAMDKIPVSSFKKYQLVTVKFAIDHKGYIVDVHIFHSSNDATIDQLLMQTINNMPQWSPAQYSNGEKVKQKFVLTVGDMQSCVLPTLNIKH